MFDEHKYIDEIIGFFFQCLYYQNKDVAGVSLMTLATAENVSELEILRSVREHFVASINRWTFGPLSWRSAAITTYESMNIGSCGNR